MSKTYFILIYFHLYFISLFWLPYLYFKILSLSVYLANAFFHTALPSPFLLLDLLCLPSLQFSFLPFIQPGPCLVQPIPTSNTTFPDITYSSLWWWRQYDHLKCYSISTRLQGDTSQKTAIFKFRIKLSIFNIMQWELHAFNSLLSSFRTYFQRVPIITNKATYIFKEIILLICRPLILNRRPKPLGFYDGGPDRWLLGNTLHYRLIHNLKTAEKKCCCHNHQNKARESCEYVNKRGLPHGCRRDLQALLLFRHSPATPPSCAPFRHPGNQRNTLGLHGTASACNSSAQQERIFSYFKYRSTQLPQAYKCKLI